MNRLITAIGLLRIPLCSHLKFCKILASDSQSDSQPDSRSRAVAPRPAGPGTRDAPREEQEDSGPKGLSHALTIGPKTGLLTGLALLISRARDVAHTHDTSRTTCHATQTANSQLGTRFPGWGAIRSPTPNLQCPAEKYNHQYNECHCQAHHGSNCCRQIR